jgi:predicted transcriptional regulator
MDANPNLTEHTADIVAAYVSNNQVRTEDLPNLINTVRSALESPGSAQAPAEKPVAPMSWKKAIKPDGIISFEDGKSYKSMKRHLTRLGMTPAQYREKWSLPKDFPMVSPNYSAARSEMARNLGLGQKGRGGGKGKKGAKKAA